MTTAMLETNTSFNTSELAKVARIY